MANTTKLWTNFNGQGFASEYAEYAKRASADESGNSLVLTVESGKVTKIGDKAIAAASATQDASGNVITTTYATKAETGTLLDGKVDKVTGKGLSTNDFTNENQEKLTGIAAGAQVNVLEGVSIDGTALTPSNKVANVPKASGTSGSYVTGVVGGDDVERWNSWTSADKQIPYEYVTIGDRAYRVVTIGNKKWMAENLDYLPEGIELLTTYSSGTTIDNSGKSAYYYSFDEVNAKSKNLGLLYNLKAFKDIVTNQASLFPEGWRIPVKADFDSIFTALNLPYYDQGGVLMKNVNWASSDWNKNATDTVGFAAIPSGCVYNNTFSQYAVGFGCAGNYTWNTNVPNERSGMWLQYATYHNTNTSFESSRALSIRLVKDA